MCLMVCPYEEHSFLMGQSMYCKRVKEAKGGTLDWNETDQVGVTQSKTGAVEYQQRCKKGTEIDTS